jgi:hypothetical protein
MDEANGEKDEMKGEREMSCNERMATETLSKLRNLACYVDNLQWYMDRRDKRALFRKYHNTLVEMAETITSLCKHPIHADSEGGKCYNGKKEVTRICSVCHTKIGRLCEGSPTGLCVFPKVRPVKGKKVVRPSKWTNSYWDTSKPNPTCNHCGRAENLGKEELAQAEREYESIVNKVLPKEDKERVKAFQREAELQDRPLRIEP